MCRTEASLAFLTDLGLTLPDPVDDVVRNILPKYETESDQERTEYEEDIRRILAAFATDSKSQREKLLAALSEVRFVMSIDPGDDSRHLSRPAELYLATQRLKEIFEGISGVLLVDDSYACLKGEVVRDLLEACGATRYLQPIKLDPEFTWQERLQMRQDAGCESSTRGETIEDHTLRGLNELLTLFPKLDSVIAARKAALLWDALIDLEDRRGAGTFLAEYWWFFHYDRNYEFDAAFVRTLNNSAWVPNQNGRLEQPSFVMFADTRWKTHPFLQSKIHFKPPIIEALAKEAGLELALLDLLKRLGVTSEAELRSRFNISDDNAEQESAIADEPAETPSTDPIKELLGEASPPTPAIEQEPEPTFFGSGGVGPSGGTGVGVGGTSTPQVGSRPPQQNSGSRPSGGDGRGHTSQHRSQPSTTRKFVSYVATSPDEEDPDPDGLTHAQRIALEEAAIQLITDQEPQLHRTGTNNTGFDLVEIDDDEEPIRWVEVKAMKGTLKNRPVGLSKAQFECAQRSQDDYWLCVVEQADSPDARIVRIKNPAGEARTFTFDHGWEAIAEP